MQQSKQYKNNASPNLVSELESRIRDVLICCSIIAYPKPDHDHCYGIHMTQEGKVDMINKTIQLYFKELKGSSNSSKSRQIGSGISESLRSIRNTVDDRRRYGNAIEEFEINGLVHVSNLFENKLLKSRLFVFFLTILIMLVTLYNFAKGVLISAKGLIGYPVQEQALTIVNVSNSTRQNFTTCQKFSQALSAIVHFIVQIVYPKVYDTLKSEFRDQMTMSYQERQFRLSFRILKKAVANELTEITIENIPVDTNITQAYAYFKELLKAEVLPYPMNMIESLILMFPSNRTNRTSRSNRSNRSNRMIEMNGSHARTPLYLT